MHPGPEKRPTSLVEWSGDRIGMGLGPGQDQNHGRGGIGIEAGQYQEHNRDLQLSLAEIGTGEDSSHAHLD
jgi:hypothetical protein